VIFITGTSTGVGKTVLTALLLCHLRRTGCNALALKPFCSGSRGDVRLLQTLQDGALSAEEINPWFFPEPVAPLVSARKHRRHIPLEQVVAHIKQMKRRCDCLLVEGAGGLLVPLGEGYSILDLIRGLQCEVLIVARNQLGILNHTLLTVRALQHRLPHASRLPPHASGGTPAAVALMGSRRADASCSTNSPILAELLGQVPVIDLPYLGPRCRRAAVLRDHAAKLRRQLARLIPARPLG
jgi:dethiobiotin synthase